MRHMGWSFAFGVTAVLTSIACAPAEEQPDTGDTSESEDAELRRARPGEYGGWCGGFAAIQCKAGLTCKLGAEHPDAAGTCVEEVVLPGSPGGACGGVANIQCRGGLECQLSGDFPDASGTCAKAPVPGQAGGICGGFAGIQCKTGFECKVVAPHPDATGTCVPK